MRELLSSPCLPVTLSPCLLHQTGRAPFQELVELARILRPAVAIVLGSGLGRLSRRVSERINVAYSEIDGLAATSVDGHEGCLAIGEWKSLPILLFKGRLHHYEGNPWSIATHPVRIAASLGVRYLILTNSAGGIHDLLEPGTVMAIRDHIDWTRPYCWRRPGPGCPSAARPSPYSARLLALMKSAAIDAHIDLHHGVYAAVTGPCYETPAEIRALRPWGADAVGMSTAREIEVGAELGLECVALSCITNRAAGLSAGLIHHEEVLSRAAATCDRIGDLLESLLRVLDLHKLSNATERGK